MIRKNIARAVVATGAAAALVVLGGGTANAAVVDPSSTGITLDTDIHFNADDTLLITAKASFTTSFIENTTVALQVVGVETWTDSAGSHANPLVGSPVGVNFGSTNQVSYFVHLHHNAVVNVNYTAEAAGLAPSPFTGSCVGTGVQLSSGNTITYKDC